MNLDVLLFFLIKEFCAVGYPRYKKPLMKLSAMATSLQGNCAFGLRSLQSSTRSFRVGIGQELSYYLTLLNSVLFSTRSFSHRSCSAWALTALIFLISIGKLLKIFLCNEHS